MNITVQIPKELLAQVGIDESLMKKYLEEMTNRFIVAQMTQKKMEAFIKKYQDVLPQTDEEVEALIDELKKDD